MCRVSFTLLLLFARLAAGEYDLIYSSDPRVQCTPRQALGKYACCCYQNTCSAKGYGFPCDGDLAKTCTANQLRGPGPGDGFNSTFVTVGQCGNICDRQKYSYSWSCCDPPAEGNWYPYVDGSPPNSYCPSPPAFEGCTESNEVLNAESDCVNTTCPNLAPMSSDDLTYHETVVANAFQSSVQGLIDCVNGLDPEGDPAYLIVQSTSRCGASPPDEPLRTNGFSAHQVGMAIDTNLQLPNGMGCNRACMAQGYCAFHQDSPSCVDNAKTCPNCQGQPQNERNTLVNNFFICAGKIPGLEVGATFTKGDWNHFEQNVPDHQTALQKFAPQLKAFCNGLCPEKIPAKNLGDYMCTCPGF